MIADLAVELNARPGIDSERCDSETGVLLLDQHIRCHGNEQPKMPRPIGFGALPVSNSVQGLQKKDRNRITANR
jgi:hypothetical protein